jgi:hypothetical protein
MLLEEVENFANDETVCKFCKGTGYHPNPTDKERENRDPREPIECPYCFCNGIVDSSR